MAEDDTEQFSDDEIYQDIGDDFDLLELNEEERVELAAFVNNHDSDSGDELDDENLPLFYHRCPRFEWTGVNYVPPAQNDNHPKYSRHSGLSVFLMRQSHRCSVPTFSTQNKSFEIW